MSNLQPGKYRARPVNAQFGISEKGKDFIAISFEIDFEDGSSEGVTAYQYFSTEGNIAQSMKALRNCGWRGDDLSADLQADGFGTAEVELDMQNETNPETGDVALKVKWVNRPGGPVVANPMDDNAKKAFAARLRGVALLSKPAAGAASKAPPLAPRAAAKPANGAPGPDPNDPRFANDVGAGTRDGIPFLPGSNRGSRQREHWRRFYRRTIRHESLRNVRAHREQPQQRGPPQALGSRARRASRGLCAQGAAGFVLRVALPEARGLRRSREGADRSGAPAYGGAAGEGVAAVTTLCPMCSQEVTDPEARRGILINAIAVSGERVTRLRHQVFAAATIAVHAKLSQDLRDEEQALAALRDRARIAGIPMTEVGDG